MLKYLSEMHLRKIGRCLRPNVEYFLKETSIKRNGFMGIKNYMAWAELVVTSEENKEPLKLVYNSDRSLSFYSTTVGKWLQTSCLDVRLDQ